jgi:hypothetical protein
MSLLENTQTLLSRAMDRGLKVPDICNASDGAIDRDWLYRFARGDIPNPGVKNIQSLHDCLKKLKLTN